MKKVLIAAFLLQSLIFAQPEPVNPDHTVYFFLRKASISGFLNGYDDAILPKSRNEIKKHLQSLLQKQTDLPPSLKSEFELYREMFLTEPEPDDASFKGLFLSKKSVSLFSYKGEGYEGKIDPVFNIKIHGTGDEKYSDRTALYMRYGVFARFNYRDWLSVYAMAWNGNSYGSRGVNALDPVVGQNFTFNQTGLSHFDGTEGGIFFEKEIFTASIARDRLLWGENFFNRDKISGASQMFDRLSFGINTGFFSYHYTHGWLVTPREIIPGMGVTDDIKTKTPKYTVQNRISFAVSERLRLSLWQAVIYSRRSPELGYLNPFLFWESVQRSLNDLDNSFIGFDARYRPVDGVELTGSLILDDVNFSYWTPDNFQKYNNRFAFLTGISYIPRFLPAVTLSASYYFVRPYTFSHPGAGEDLAYLNNSYPLGLDVQPNSDMVNFRIDWQVAAPLKIALDLKHIRHGANTYGPSGELLQNNGGSFFTSINAISKEDAWFLAGEFQNSTTVDLSFHLITGANTSIKGGFITRRANFKEDRPENYFYLSASLFYF